MVHCAQYLSESLLASEGFKRLLPIVKCSASSSHAMSKYKLLQTTQCARWIALLEPVWEGELATFV
jgi:hypothetical protein